MSGAVADNGRMTGEERKVIFASSLGTMLDWYDFYLYGAMTAQIGAKFFSQYPESTRAFFALLAFAVGFLVRPFGALFFGHYGDRFGRKVTFFVTLLVMGGSTVAVGILPSAATIGIAAPVLLILFRAAQGFAMGGEYGGAATYVAEHSRPDRRGLSTAYIQTTATAGLIMSLLVVLALQKSLGTEAFNEWGWRVPFLLSALLLFVSAYVRLKMTESPAFLAMLAAGETSKSPIRETFGSWRNIGLIVGALFGLVAGMTVIWYCSQFYALVFITNVLKVDGVTANFMMTWALLLGTPFFLFFGWLSDRVGRKRVLLSGCALAAVLYFPLFHTISATANPELDAARERVSVVVKADPATCSFLFNPIGTAKFTSDCDVARLALIQASAAFRREEAPAGAGTTIQIGSQVVPGGGPNLGGRIAQGLADVYYPAASNPSIVRMTGPFDLNHWRVGATIALLWLLVVLATIPYGPIAAAMTELFPTRIRYTAMSFPYHLGAGWIGGVLPASIIAINTTVGNPFAGLWYPVGFALLSVVVGTLFVPETQGKDIFAEDGSRNEKTR